MTKINEHARHSSETVRSTNDAGGEVSPGQYRQPVPAPTPAPKVD
jgi:hypothetical protein